MRTRTALALATATTLALSACGAGRGPSGEAATQKLDVVSWWTSGSEKAALSVLYDAFHKTSPGVEVTDAAVAGGSGSNVQVVLASRLQRGDPPDVWQSFPGASLQQLVSSGRVVDVSSVLNTAGMSGQLPKAVLDSLTVGGKHYGVPTSAHRQNVLWFNRKVLARAGVNPPRAGYTKDAFLADLAKLKRAGLAPLCLGGKDAFTKVELFENVLLGTVGTAGWSQLSRDRFDWGGAPVNSALATFGAVLDNADPQADGLTWDQASQKLAKGGCGFESMNDSVYGEVLKAGASADDIGQVAFPGTDQAYLSVIDIFVLANGAKNARNGESFLRAIGAKDTQLAFSKQKGSVPIRRDVPVSSLTPYQQTAAKALQDGTVLLSITHGEILSPRFQQGFYDAVGAYASGRDEASFSRTLSDAAAAGRPAGH